MNREIGRIDVHAHLLPGVDDGSRSVAESVELCRAMNQAGYTHLFCTPHFWPGFPLVSPAFLRERVTALQTEMDRAGVPVTLLPGAELTLSLDLDTIAPGELPTYMLAGRYVLFDFWDSELSDEFWPWVKRLQSMKLTVVLAHPERIPAVQNEPELLDQFNAAGMLLQANLQCLADQPGNIRRQLVERWLLEGRYYMLGSDMHRTEGLAPRLAGLARAEELLGEEAVWKLTHTNPLKLMTIG